MKLDALPNSLRTAIAAAQEKKASAITVLGMAGLGAFSEYFLMCSAESARQIEAIGEEIEHRLSRAGVETVHREGRTGTEWLLLDYGSFIVHILSEKARLFYDIERLWRHAQRLDVAAAGPPAAHGQSVP